VGRTEGKEVLACRASSAELAGFLDLVAFLFFFWFSNFTQPIEFEFNPSTQPNKTYAPA
jgi:hypothetical protein